MGLVFILPAHGDGYYIDSEQLVRQLREKRAKELAEALDEETAPATTPNDEKIHD